MALQGLKDLLKLIRAVRLEKHRSVHHQVRDARVLAKHLVNLHLLESVHFESLALDFPGLGGAAARAHTVVAVRFGLQALEGALRYRLLDCFYVGVEQIEHLLELLELQV